jgi:hypothetical protein
MSHAATSDATTTQGALQAATPSGIVLALPGTDYQLHLAVDRPLAPGFTPGPNSLVTGVIRAKARRVDVVTTGGRYIEPVYGRPRRVQGSVMAADPADNTLAVHCAPGCVMVCTLMAGQKAGNFAPGTLVSFDVERGATFDPA